MSSSSLPQKSRVLRLLAAQDRARHAREIASELDVREGQYAGLVRLLDDMVFSGQLLVRPGHRYALSKDSKKARAGDDAPHRAPRAGEPPPRKASQAMAEGYLSMTPRGAGFVAREGGDVFIAPEAIGAGMHGDKVRVSIIARGTRGPEGEVTEVLERGSKRVAGTLRRRGKSAWLEPDDTRIRGPIVLPSAVDMVSGEGNSGRDGDAAVVSITEYPTRSGENPEGKLEAILGAPGELSVEVAKILISEQVEEVHDEQATREADAYGETVPAHMLEGRLDLTHLPLPTIDPEDARDHDDAVWVERTASGGYRAYIAIADVSSYVKPGTKLDEESRLRGCSVYLPNRAVPMLPRALSSNLCSLLPHQIRLCLCAEVELDASGEVVGEKLHRAFMNSRAKLTYGGVARALGLTDKGQEQIEAHKMVDGLRVAYDLSRILRAKRLKRGALDLELPEAKIILDEESGHPTDVEKRAMDPGVARAYQLIEELMLLANEVVARWLVARKCPTVFRVHAPPDEAKLERFLTLCDQLGFKTDLEAVRDPRELSKLLKSMVGHPKAAVLHGLLLRSLKQATYEVTNIGHFGLASKAYVHFTSPIRRYPDVLVHRGVHAVLEAERRGRRHTMSDEEQEKLAEAALLSSKNERKAMEVEREVSNLYRAFMMRDKVGSRYEGTVSGLVGGGVYVNLDAPFVDVLVRYEDLGGDRYELDDTGLRAVGERSGDAIQLGDKMAIEVVDVSLLRRTVYGKRTGGAESRNERRRGREQPKHPPRGKSAQRPQRRVQKGRKRR
ncbi:MAG TPA: ribonuclease R [Polyangiaceae bacterium]|nr:ribonuclease R [Polyangiaceae bacterium]